MNPKRWDPLEDIDTLRRSMNHVFDEFFTTTNNQRMPHDASTGVAGEWAAAVEVYETDGDVVVRAEMPNVDSRSVDVTITNESITIKGQTRSDEQRPDRTYHARELRRGTFVRVVPLPAAVKSGEAKASYKDGVLEVKVPRVERVKPTTVKVQVASGQDR
jgi:HSP20 family protein